MEQINGTTLFFFILKGFSDVPKLQLPIFLLVILLYLIILGGNLIILLLLWLDPQLHTPMYFFLGNLSFIDMSSTTINLHKFFTSFLSGDYTISFSCCMTQLYMFSSLTTDELLLLTAMSYDRYVAICNPLNYHSVMNNQLWCYRSNIVNHFFCDMVPVLNLSCNDVSAFESLNLIETLSLGLPSFLQTFTSYMFITCGEDDPRELAVAQFNWIK
ncbi:olfactory receptor 13C9-like [Discoglossus pictus]